MKRSVLVLLVACSSSPTSVVVEMDGVETRVPLDMLEHHDVVLWRGCEMGRTWYKEPGAFISCPSEGTRLACSEATKQKHQVLSTRGREFSAWCE